MSLAEFRAKFGGPDRDAPTESRSRAIFGVILLSYRRELAREAVELGYRDIGGEG